MPLTIVVRAAPPEDGRRPRPDQRFRDGARIYRILAVREFGPEARYLTCIAEEEQSS
jgi:hypothetical protein